MTFSVWKASLLPVTVGVRRGGRRGQQGPVPASRSSSGSATKKPAKPQKKSLYLRKEFPETWLWTEEMVK